MSNEAVEIDVKLDEPLRDLNGIYDELNIIDGKVTITRRIGVNEDLSLYLLEEETIEELGNLQLTTFDNNTYVYIKEYYNLDYIAKYIVKNEYSDNFITKVEANTKIEETANSIKLNVNQKLENYSTTEEMNASINMKADEISQEVNKKVGKDELGTKIEQNWEHIKYAWNKITEFIQMEVLNGNASLAFRKDANNLLMALDRLGQHFYNSNGKIFAEMGVKKVDNQNYIAFSVPSEYSKKISDGMAWGITTSSDNKFHPVLFMKNFEMGNEESDSTYGQLELSNCDLIVGGNYELGSGGSVLIGNLRMTGNIQNGMSFIDDSGNYLFTIYKGEGSGLAPCNTVNILNNEQEGNLNIFNNISFYKNEAGSNTFALGIECNEEGKIIGAEAYITDDGNITGNSIGIFGSSYIFTGDLTISKGNIYANNITSDKRLKENIKESTASALDIIKKIKHKRFKMKTNGKHYDIGYIAQELEKIDENFVLKRETKSDEELKDYQYYINELPIIATATKAIQEQQEQIENQNNLIQSLIKRIEKLEGGSKNAKDSI